MKMTNNEVERLVKNMKKFTKDLPNQPRIASQELLISAGICNKNGKLKRIYNKK